MATTHRFSIIAHPASGEVQWEITVGPPEPVPIEASLPLECGWCGRRLEDAEPIVTITLMRGAGEALPPAGFLQLKTGRRRIPALIPARDSGAATHGAAALIILCSDRCATAVRSVIAGG